MPGLSPQTSSKLRKYKNVSSKHLTLKLFYFSLKVKEEKQRILRANGLKIQMEAINEEFIF